jgi:hypothetical protein
MEGSLRDSYQFHGLFGRVSEQLKVLLNEIATKDLILMRIGIIVT